MEWCSAIWGEFVLETLQKYKYKDNQIIKRVVSMIRKDLIIIPILLVGVVAGSIVGMGYSPAESPDDDNLSNSNISTNSTNANNTTIKTNQSTKQSTSQSTSTRKTSTSTRYYNTQRTNTQTQQQTSTNTQSGNTTTN